MTADEWRTTFDVLAMLRALPRNDGEPVYPPELSRRVPADRGVLRFAVWCRERVYDFEGDEEVAEVLRSVGDGFVLDNDGSRDHLYWGEARVQDPFLHRRHACAVDVALSAAPWLPEEDEDSWVRAADVLREYVGNPFDPVILDPAFLAANDGAAKSMAAHIDATGDFSLMPVLADALEDAGCDHAGMVAHCRDGRDHRRGCWVIDGLLGRRDMIAAPVAEEKRPTLLQRLARLSPAATCPRCGSAEFDPARDGVPDAWQDRRACRRCLARYTPPVTPWAVAGIGLCLGLVVALGLAVTACSLLSGELGAKHAGPIAVLGAAQVGIAALGAWAVWLWVRRSRRRRRREAG